MNGRQINVLLTGASGTVGQEVLKQVAKDKAYNITVFDQKTKLSQKRLARYTNDVTIVYGDITKKKDLENACQSQDVILHLAAIIPPLAEEKKDLAYQVNVVGTRNLVETVEALSKDAFFVYASSVAVYGDRINDLNIQVGDPVLKSIDAYSNTKIEGESIVQNSSLDWTIFRLSSILGINNHKMSNMMFLMPLATLMEFTTPEDTGRAFVNSIKKKALLKNTIFNLGGGKQLCMKYGDFIEKSFELKGLGTSIFPEKSFAEKNFHCGFYADGDQLNDILNFRNATLESYFDAIRESTNPIAKSLTYLFRKPIQKYLLKQSEPYKAFLDNDKELIERFFND